MGDDGIYNFRNGDREEVVSEEYEEELDESEEEWKDAQDFPENCLKGMACPKCSQYEQFTIEGACMFHVTDEGTEPFNEAVQWCDESYAACPECNWHGAVKDLHKAGLKLGLSRVKVPK